MIPSLLLLSGPSCIGKSPLVNTVRRFYPEWGSKLQKLMLFNNRAPRPGEVDGEDYHFRSHAEVISYQGKPGFITIPVRNDWQALELETIFQIQEQGKIPLFEGNPYLVEALREVGLFERIPATTVFLSPLSKEEIVYLRQPSRHVDLPVLVTQVMRKKQLRRKQKQMGLLSQPDLEDIEIRCQAAYAEMRYA
ncbi:MAG: hypothetical protein RBU29_17510, partial [bacterium]|nr:hypothetical protein [bacterium]